MGRGQCDLGLRATLQGHVSKRGPHPLVAGSFWALCIYLSWGIGGGAVGVGSECREAGCVRLMTVGGALEESVWGISI